MALQEEYDYGYGICAPLISKFAVWLYETIKKEAVDNILFAARDGYLMQTLYCMTRKRTTICLYRRAYIFIRPEKRL